MAVCGGARRRYDGRGRPTFPRRIPAMLTALVLTMLTPAAQDQKEYAKPDLLAEPAALKKESERKGFVILDARRKAEYLIGHVPGAVWVDHAAWAKAFAKGGDKAEW